MISDELSDAAIEIQRYLDDPATGAAYDAETRVKIAAVLAAMDELRAELDTPMSSDALAEIDVDQSGFDVMMAESEPAELNSRHHCDLHHDKLDAWRRPTRFSIVDDRGNGLAFANNEEKIATYIKEHQDEHYTIEIEARYSGDFDGLHDWASPKHLAVLSKRDRTATATQECRNPDCFWAKIITVKLYPEFNIISTRYVASADDWDTMYVASLNPSWMKELLDKATREWKETEG